MAREDVPLSAGAAGDGARGGVPPASFPAPWRGWLLVGFFVVAYALSFVDRQILGLLVEDLRHDLAIGDAQVGLLAGPAFGVFYAVMGMPLGWLADRTHRVRLIAGGLLVWTLMTLLGGFSDTFGQLFLTRIGVGFGEAALVPAAVSLLADSFAPQRRALPLAVFTAGYSLGAGLSLLLGGLLVDFAHHGAASLPLVGGWFAGRAPWQSVLILAGALGIPVSAAILALPDPPRRSVARAGTADGLLRHLGRHRALFVPFLAGTSSLYLFSNAFAAWMPSLFVRGFGWSAVEVGQRVGPRLLVATLAGTLLGGGLATLLARRGRADGASLTMAIGGALLAPLAIAAPLAASAAIAQVGVMLVYLCITLCFGVATATFVAVTPPNLRGRMVALYLLLGNLVGLGLGPPSVGWLLDRFFHDPARVGSALAVVGCAAVVPGAALLILAFKRYRGVQTSVAG